VRCDDRPSEGLPVSAGASKSHPAFGERQSDLDCVMGVKLRGLPGAADPETPSAPDRDTPGSRRLHDASPYCYRAQGARSPHTLPNDGPLERGVRHQRSPLPHVRIAVRVAASRLGLSVRVENTRYWPVRQRHFEPNVTRCWL